MPVITDGSTASEAGVSAERLKVGLFASDGTTELLSVDGAVASSTTGFMPISGRNDASLRALNLDRRGSLQLAPMVLGLNEQIEGTTIDTQSKWTATATTMAAAQTAAGGLVINSGAITTLNTNYTLLSQRQFERKMRNPLFFRARARFVNATNSTLELGFIGTTGATAQANGCYWQMTPGGVLQPVVTFNSNDTTGTNIAGSVSTSNYYQFDVIVDDDSATFICQNTATGAIISEQTLALPATQAKQFAVTHVNAGARVVITTAAGTAPALHLTEVLVGYMDTAGAMNKPWTHVASEFKPSLFSPAVPTTVLPQWTNSAEPASATLSNTAAGYSSLGGKFQFAAPAGAVTDFVLFGIAIPAPYSFVCTGISISTWNVGAAVATTPHLLQWFLAPNSLAVSLASNTARFALGSQSFPIAAAIGQNADREVVRSFQTPLITGPGRFFDIGLRIPVGTATASQVIAGIIGVEGYFE